VGEIEVLRALIGENVLGSCGSVVGMVVGLVIVLSLHGIVESHIDVVRIVGKQDIVE